MKKQPAIIKKKTMTRVVTQFSKRNCRIFPGLFNKNCSFSKDTNTTIKTDKKSLRFVEFQPKGHRQPANEVGSLSPVQGLTDRERERERERL